jgi:hypothetical protein
MFESIAGVLTGVTGLVRELLGFGSSVNEHDVELYEKYTALFITNGAAEFYRHHDFLMSFEEALWKPLSGYVENWDTVEHEFVNRKLRRKHAKVYQSAKALGIAIATYTVPIGNGTLRSVKPDHVSKPVPENIKEEARKINVLRPAFAEAHQNFVRLANRKLRRRTA